MFYRLENGSSRRLSSVSETPFSPFISRSVDRQKDVHRGTEGFEASRCCPSGTDTIPASALLPPGSCLWVRPPGWVSLAHVAGVMKAPTIFASGSFFILQRPPSLPPIYLLYI